MKQFLAHVRNTVISGIILLLPVFVVIIIVQKMFAKLTGFGKQLSDFLGLKTIGGVGAASIATTFILVTAFYLVGLLVRFTMVTNIRNWIENNLLQYIPGYLGYKVKMEEKLMPKADERIAALISVNGITRPGFLVSREGDQCVVFMPNTPDTNAGEVWVVKAEQVKELGKTDAAFLNSIRHSGKGLVIKA